MKFLIPFFVFFVVAQCTYLTGTDTRTDLTRTSQDTRTDTDKDTFWTHTYGAKFGTTTKRTGDKLFLTRHRDILRLLDHVMTLNTNKDQTMIAKDFRFDTHMDKFMNKQAVKEFMMWFKIGHLQRNKVFTITNDRHRDEAIGLFHVMFYAKDFETFYKVCCWARDNMNEGVFVYAMTVAMLHRRDTKGMTMPPPYEIYPFYFFNTEVINKVQRLKMQERVIDTKLAELNGIRRTDTNTFVVKSNYTGWYVDTNDETLLSYFTEDIGLNTYYYYFHCTHPFWMKGDMFGIDNERRGELYLYKHQQLMARYYMERLSNNMGKINKFMWTRPIKTGFTSSLRHHNGLQMPSRPNNFLIKTEDNLWDLTDVRDYERRIRDSIAKGHIRTDDGRIMSLNKPEDIEMLGNIIQGNKDCMNTRYYILGTMVAKRLLSNTKDTTLDTLGMPGVMEHYETALRDPMFYQLCKRLLHNMMRFKKQLRPYTRDEVAFDGVRIDDVYVDKLVTYFDTVDSDITNAVWRKEDEMDTNRDKFLIKVRQERLNHLPFDVKIDITSDKATEAVVKIFLGPKYDNKHRRIKFNDNRWNFFEMDTFTYDLKTGKNTITRNSRDFCTTTGDRMMTRDMIKKITTCLTGTEECVVDTTEFFTAFPDRLLLPKGKRIGMTFQLFVSVTPLRKTKTFTSTNKMTTNTDTNIHMIGTTTTGLRFVDDNALGYPLDRTIDVTTFFNTNMFLRDVTIFHKTDRINTTDMRDMDRDTRTKPTDDTYRTGYGTEERIDYDTLDRTDRMTRFDGRM